MAKKEIVHEQHKSNLFVSLGIGCIIYSLLLLIWARFKMEIFVLIVVSVALILCFSTWFYLTIADFIKRLKASNIDMWIYNSDPKVSFSSKDYYSNMFGVNTVEELLAREGGKEILKNALEKAHDIRKFEIELFWKRANYYWVLIVFLFGAFSVTLKYLIDIPVDEGKPKLTEQFLINLLTAIAYMGYLMSVFWTEIVKSSKIWYENWEKHINMLEYHVTGNLHKIVPQVSNDIAVASISKITLASSFLIAIVWLIIFSSSLFLLYDDENWQLGAIIIYLVITILMLSAVNRFCLSTSANKTVSTNKK